MSVVDEAKVQFVRNILLGNAGLLFGERPELDQIAQAGLLTGTLTLEDGLVDSRGDVFTKARV